MGEVGVISSGGQVTAGQSATTVPSPPATLVADRATADSGLQAFLVGLKELVHKFEPGPSGIQPSAAAWVPPGVGGATNGLTTGTGTSPGPATEPAAPATEVARVAGREVVPKTSEGATVEGAKNRT